VETLKSLFQEVTSLHHKIEEVTRSRDEFRERYEVLVHQLKEIQSVSPKPKEDEELLQAERIAGSSEKLFELSEKVYAGLYEQESSVLEALAGMKSSLDQLREIDGRFTETLEQFQTATIMLEEIARQIGEYRDRIHFDPGALEGIRERLVQIQRLKKKYGTLDDTLAKQQELSEQIRFHDNFDNELQQLRNRLAEEGRKYAEAAQTVRTRRRKAALALDKRIVEEMKQLGMSHARFSTAMVPLPSGRVSIDMDGHGVWIGPKGVDDVAFLISTNAGEEVKPLIKVASGGEISRIMLSLKAVMAASDNIPTLVFDEIDVGISGRIAQTVGRALHTLGRSHQVICITHLPQIASMSERHFSVAKTETGRRTVTQIRVLSGEEKIHEIAKLLGGETVTETALKNARELVASTR
jgi:DNA repair protein RecN (Recombination protein N)